MRRTKAKKLKNAQSTQNSKNANDCKLLGQERARAKGITLIALIITIIVLLILARSKYSNINRRKWIIK